MASILKTPGVYIEEKDAFATPITAIPSAVPVFIGYTEKAEWNGKSLVHKPTRITSFAEYTQFFGGAFHARFVLAEPHPNLQQTTFNVDGKQLVVQPNKHQAAYLFNAIRLFYANGGGPAYILSTGTYQGKKELDIQQEDFGDAVFGLLKEASDVTLVVIPDAIALGRACYQNIYTKVLQHCADTGSCFGIFDIRQPQPGEDTQTVISEFRQNIGTTSLSYGAAYYPWLKTNIVSPAEVTFNNLDDSVNLKTLLPEPEARQVIERFKPEVDTYAAMKDADKTAQHKKEEAQAKQQYHEALKAASPTYDRVLQEVMAQLNVLPPSGAIAGLYTYVDNSRGAWKAPANVSVSNVNAPTVNITHEEMDWFTVDVGSGKSINVIRSMAGIGTLIWGARTLDGNNQDWRYISVRRTCMMIEQTLKMACRTYAFEPNVANTWITLKQMVSNFLTGLWKQGALAAPEPDTAFQVLIGLGESMAPTDVLDGNLVVKVKVAITRPGEFIEITCVQKMQQAG